MRCPKCDSTLPIGGKVCKTCNYNVYTNQYEPAARSVQQAQQPVRQAPVQQPVRQAPAQQPVQQTPVQPRPAVNPTPAPRPAQQTSPVQQSAQAAAKPQQKKGSWFTRFVGTVVSFVLVVTVSYAARSVVYHWPVIRDTLQATFSKPVQKEPSAAFVALLAEKGITYTNKISTMSSECFAKAPDAYSFEILEYGYAGDRIKEQYDTIYYDVSAYSEADIQQIESSMKSSIAVNMPYCTADYSRIGGKYLVVQLHIAAMDEKETIQALVTAGRIALQGGKVPDAISMDQSREGLLANGYIQ